MKNAILVIAFLGFVYQTAAFSQENSPVPGPAFKDVLSIKSVRGARISPDGSAIAYTVRSTDWENNRYDTEIWLVRDGEEPIQLTRTKDGSSYSPSWSPDGKWIAFLTDRGDKTQIFIINSRGGEAQVFTGHKEGIGSFDWSPDGKKIAFTAQDSLSEDSKDRKELYGNFEIDDEEFRMTHLWITDFNPDSTAKATRLTSGDEYTVSGYEWSPGGSRIAFVHRPDPLVISWGKSDISILDVESGEITPLVTQPGPDGSPLWSPDGKWILFNTSMGAEYYYYANRELAKIPADGGNITVLTESFDENPNAVKWTVKGIYFIASQKSLRHLFLLHPDNHTCKVAVDSPEIINGISFAEDNLTVAVTAYDRTTLSEIYKTTLNNYRPVMVTDMTSQVKDWALGTREIIKWKSKDGTEIEGILWKPEDYDPDRKYPLLVSIHGGPTGTSRPALVSTYVYPFAQWLAKGAVILQPNYRGSAGYGAKFRSLNVRNLGVGDAWDVESGVDYLVKTGVADKNRVGAMGWSQGGYISSFLSCNSSKFKAISMGAGISNWMTYYVNTDIHPFTRQYLKATPWDDEKIYKKTSPMTNIKKAQTPTLIQHGEFDRRVPIPNAYEMLQGLRDMGVDTKLIVYKGFGHGISKPKEVLAATWHNWQWFAKYIWDEKVKMPLKDK